MPFTDLDKKIAGNYSPPETDTVIIGAGTAGIFLAADLAGRGKKVLVVESGNFTSSDDKQKLNTVEQTGKYLRNAEWGRKRVIGGTTVAWGGQSLPFTPLDFKKRPWVQNSGWPISIDELSKWYKAADQFMEIDTLNYTTDIFPRIGIKDPGINPDHFDLHVAKWTNHTDFYRHHKKTLEDKVYVLYNAQLTDINRDDDGRVISITVSNFNKEMFVIPVNTLVIAAGTIESIRILLNNNTGDHSGLLGKYFMDHPCVEVGTIQAKNMYQLQKQFNTHTWNKRKYSVRLSLSPEFQLKHKLLNCSVSIMFRQPKSAFDVYAEIKSFIKDKKLKRLIKITGNLGAIIKSAAALLVNKFYYKQGAEARVSLMLEQEPTLDSCISLSPDTDEFNMPQASIHWSVTKKSWDTVVASAALIKSEIERLGLGKVSLHEHIDASNTRWEDHLSDVCHNMGGCRMSATPGEGVVDKDLCVWGTPNLYVCSQAVFPTGSHSNPVLTMLALALRLSNHLATVKERIPFKEEVVA
jgi:hypothetical protein